ncbi:hypothetical protein CHS0354_006318 [Potamilus streckersoni]|uniref:Uncharacterized protein n=1 Tax=Potamilus streckersoni TaxID=2493646 RepID=A0AAE0S4P4_9BIVA|nr:hypothetical protein CHS0354_006318 [Potamilus streckersoni]
MKSSCSFHEQVLVQNDVDNWKLGRIERSMNCCKSMFTSFLLATIMHTPVFSVPMVEIFSQPSKFHLIPIPHKTKDSRLKKKKIIKTPILKFTLFLSVHSSVELY